MIKIIICFIFYLIRTVYINQQATNHLKSNSFSQMSEILSSVAKVRQQQISQQETAIRQFFQKFNSPYYYISYADFCNNFQAHAGKNFKQQNLNIIDTHLKYRQWCYEEMAPYKWAPILIYSAFRLLRLRSPPLIIPYLYTSLFDHYMEPFFAWKNKDKKIINVRYEFASKLSKIKNKERRVKLWKNLQNSLKRTDQVKGQDKKEPEIPHKYIKFGFPSEYIFHAQSNGNQMSTILQTTFFQTFLNFRYPTTDFLKDLGLNLLNLKDKFLEFKKDKQRQKYILDLEEFKKFKDINENEWYQFSTRIERRVRRWLETLMYERQNTIYYSNWTMDKISYFYEHKHLTEEPKFNIETNSADLFLYYTAVIVPTILLKFFKR